MKTFSAELSSSGEFLLSSHCEESLGGEMNKADVNPAGCMSLASRVDVDGEMIDEPSFLVMLFEKEVAL